MKYFITSDVHGFFDEMIKSLAEAGFDRNNNNHTLVIAGDPLDRGGKPLEVIEYLESLERVILIKGNHEYMLEEVMKHNEITPIDVYNGLDITVKALLDKYSEKEDRTWSLTKAAVDKFHSKFINFFETEHYIFVHSWIPTPRVYGEYTYTDNWRELDDEWENASWMDPFRAAREGLNQTGKTIVFGHKRCSIGWAMDSNYKIDDYGETACWDIYRNEKLGVIGIDGCTVVTGKCNVLVLED